MNNVPSALPHSFPIIWDDGNSHSLTIAKAWDANTRVIEVAFNPIGIHSNIVELSFIHSSSTHNLIPMGDSHPILTTITNAIKYYLEKHKPDYLAFSITLDNRETSAYAALVKRAAPEYKLIPAIEYPSDLSEFIDYLGTDQPFILARL